MPTSSTSRTAQTTRTVTPVRSQQPVPLSACSPATVRRGSEVHAEETPDDGDDGPAKDNTMDAADSTVPVEGPSDGTDVNSGAVSTAEPGPAATTPAPPSEILPGATTAGRRRRKNASRQAVEWVVLVVGAVVLAL